MVILRLMFGFSVQEVPHTGGVGENEPNRLNFQLAVRFFFQFPCVFSLAEPASLLGGGPCRKCQVPCISTLTPNKTIQILSGNTESPNSMPVLVI